MSRLFLLYLNLIMTTVCCVDRQEIYVLQMDQRRLLYLEKNHLYQVKLKIPHAMYSTESTLSPVKVAKSVF